MRGPGHRWEDAQRHIKVAVLLGAETGALLLQLLQYGQRRAGPEDETVVAGAAPTELELEAAERRLQ